MIAGAPPWRQVDLPGLGPLHVRDSGPPEAVDDAPTVLLLHGWSVSADLNWCRTYGSLARRARVIAWDHRGHGPGGLRRPRSVRIESMADDTAAVARALDVERPILVGYSMGGAVAQAAWHRHPDLVAGLVLCATSSVFGLTRDERRDFAVMGLAALPTRLLRLAGFHDHAWRLARRVGDSRADAQQGVGDAAFDQWAWDEIRVGFLDRVLQAGWHLGRFDSRGWIGDMEVPHAVVVCEADEIVPTDRQRQLAEALPAATVVEVAGAHGACVNRADLFVPALERALDAVTAPVGR